MTILEYHKINNNTETIHNIKYMGLGDRIKKHNFKLKKDANNDTFKTIQNPVKYLDHRSITLHLNLAKKFVQTKPKKGNRFNDNHITGINKPYKNE